MNNISNINYKSSYSFSESNYNAGKCGSGHTLSGDIPQGNATYDAARKNMGEPWMMFTKDQGQELIDHTTSTWTTINGVNGRKFTSKTDSSKYIFLPAGGRWRDSFIDNIRVQGNYRSSTRISLSLQHCLDFDNSGRNVITYDSSHMGRSIRLIILQQEVCTILIFYLLIQRVSIGQLCFILLVGGIQWASHIVDNQIYHHQVTYVVCQFVQSDH